MPIPFLPLARAAASGLWSDLTGATARRRITDLEEAFERRERAWLQYAEQLSNEVCGLKRDAEILTLRFGHHVRTQEAQLQEINTLGEAVYDLTEAVRGNPLAWASGGN